MIKITSLNKFYNKNKSNENHVIKNLNIELPSTGLVGIFGKSGCGKTTLLNLIGGLDKYNSGSILINNSMLTSNDDELRNKYIGYIFQNYNLNNNKTCYQNIEESLLLCGVKNKEEINSKVLASLKNVGMEHFEKRYPQTLSGGQMQRISIARAIVKNPEIILADEPTGNLDEQNTYSIINLLKQLSKDRLVLLVTHEQNLVDNFCDKVIEINDGIISRFYDNTAINEFNYNNKNNIYLDELEKKSLSSNNLNIDIYGDNPTLPINIEIINKDGKLFLNVNQNEIKILSKDSEIQVLKSRPIDNANKSNEQYSFEKIDDIVYSNKQKFGKIYTLSNTIKNYFRNMFLVKKHKKTFLKIVLCLFSIALVITTSIFASKIKSSLEMKETIDKNTLYMYIPSTKVSEDVYNIYKNEDSAISSLYFQNKFPTNRDTISIIPGYFETINVKNMEMYYSTLPISLISNSDIIYGKTVNKDDEIVISKGCADYLLKNSHYSFISNYEDLINLKTASNYYTQGYTIVGISDEKNPEVFFSENSYNSTTYENVVRYKPDSTLNLSMNDGECTYIYLEDQVYDDYLPTLNQNVQANGKTFKIIDIKKIANYYETYLSENKLISTDCYSYIVNRIEKDLLDNPTSTYSELYNKHYYEYMNDYYQYYDNYVLEHTKYFNDYDSYEYCYYFLKELDSPYANFVMTEDLGFYEAKKYYTQNSKYPTITEIEEIVQNDNENVINNEISNILSPILKTKENTEGLFYYIAINENEVSQLPHRYGNTDKSIRYYSYDYYYAIDDLVKAKLIWWDVNYDVFSENSVYAIIQSTNIEKTINILNEYAKQNNITNPVYDNVVLSYIEITNELKLVDNNALIANIIVSVIMIVVMSICIYFIMKTNMMNNIKEIGIYRAIGLSKKNIIFKNYIEMTLLFIITILISFIITSLIVTSWINKSTILATTFYYPFWLAITLLISLYGIFTLFGLLPITNLLKKQPSDILTQYDI